MFSSNALRGILIYTAANLGMAVMAVLVKLMPRSLGTGTIIFFQYFLAWLGCFPILFQHPLSYLKTPVFLKHLVRDIIGVGTFVFFFWALTYIPLTNAIVLRSTTPFWIPLILWVRYKEKISKKLWINICLGFLGVIFLIKPHVHDYASLGSLLALMAGLTLAISIFVIRWVANIEPADRTLFYYFLFATLMSAPFSAPHKWGALTAHTWLLLLGVGVLMYLMQHGFIIAFRYAKASTLAPVSYTAILFSGILEWLIFGQLPDTLAFIGILLIAYAGIVTSVMEKEVAPVSAPVIKKMS